MNFFAKNELLILIFLLALVLRFLYFPQNTYFGFDQARDAYAVKEILAGNLKIVGPPTANGVFHHGVAYYYIFAPFYLISGGDPVFVSAFLRFLNAAVVFIVYFIGLALFGRIAALVASFLFAISYEQTQFSLFLNHPSLAVVSVLIFHLGLAYWIFRGKNRGFFAALFGLGLSIQFEFVETQLVAVFILFLIFFRRHLPKFTVQNTSISLMALLLPLSSYIISEIKNNFATIKQAPSVLTGFSGGLGLTNKISQFLFIINRHFTDNFAANNVISILFGLIFLVLLIFLLINKIQRRQLVFLSLWFFGGLLVYFFINNDAYFYNTGTSISLLIFAGFLLSWVFSKTKLVALIILTLIVFSNMILITKNNPLGPNQKINPQIGLTIKDEQKVIDFIYQQAEGKEFAVNGLTMPYNVNTTWSYLFEWYGKDKYGYVPIWGGDGAAGFPGGLQIETARSKLPAKRFLIIEPQEGIPSYIAKDFLLNEGNYTKVIGEKKIGALKVLIQQPKE